MLRAAGLAAALAVGSAVGFAALLKERAAASLPPAYGLVPLPTGIDSITPLDKVEPSAGQCTSGCAGVVYAWTPRMPLSRSGIPHVIAAAEKLGVSVTLVSTEELLDYAERHDTETGVGFRVADELLAAGALGHAPALVVFAGDRAVGSAILGYKVGDAYASLVGARLGALEQATPAPPRSYARTAARPRARLDPIDREVVGLPGAYFRWVPGTRLVAYESDRSIYLVDLDDGENRLAAGWIDFVPTPDGRYFVTPGPENEGLTFFDAREVISAAEENRSLAVEPIFTDMRMRDQYPSVGILEQAGAQTRYRVLTAWFDGIVYRDYDVRADPTTGVSSVRPVGEPVVPCSGIPLSTPIMSPDGREVAARDERSGTTKIFEILEQGVCREVLDLRALTSKVAWHASRQRIAFATPRRGRGNPGEAGIFVYDRSTGTATAVPGSEGASRLAFPDFVGDDVVFLIPGATFDVPSVFRLVGDLR